MTGLNADQWFSFQWFYWDTLKSFQWEHPYFLWAVPFIPGLFWLRNILHKDSKQFLNLSIATKASMADWTVVLRFVQPVAFGLSAFLILIALARPQTVNGRTDRVSEGIDIALLVDISDSMLQKDMKPDRLAAAKKVARNFINGRLQDRIGIIIFAGEAFSLCPLTTDYELLYGFLEDLRPNMIPTAGTAIGSAIALSVNSLRDARSNTKVAILISDGDNNSGNLDPLTAAKLASAYGVRIYTIAVGKATRIFRQDSLHVASAIEKMDENELQNIALTTNGKYFLAANNLALDEVFKQIDHLEKVKYREVKFNEVKDYYRPYLYWAIVLFLIALASKSTFMSNILED